MPKRAAAGIKALQDRLETFVESRLFSRSPEKAGVKREAPWQLNALADPDFYTSPIDIEGWSRADLTHVLRIMLTIRTTEEQIGLLVESGDIVCPAHLAIGQEAVATGVSFHLSPDDRVFGAHRSHSHYLALGGDVYALIAETLGKADGCSKGMGGSMHLYGPEVGFMGSVPIVGGTVPIAAGAALAAKKDGSGNVAVAYFGDGAIEEGVVHETLNLAATMKLPLLFVCENNLYASHMDIAQRQPTDCTARIAEANGVPSAVVDGNSVVDVARAAQEFILSARAGEGPGYLEAITYRWRGHVGPDENIDVGIRRSGVELNAWKRRDPIGRLVDAMLSRGDIEATEVAAIRSDVTAQARLAAERAKVAPYPEDSALLDYVYVNNGAA